MLYPLTFSNVCLFTDTHRQNIGIDASKRKGGKTKLAPDSTAAKKDKGQRENLMLREMINMLKE